MKTFVVEKHTTPCSQKREIRDPVITDLNEKPRDDYRAVNVTQSMGRPASLYDPMASSMHMTMERHIFETHRLITMIWIEDHQSGDTSMGHYNSFISYFHVPQGTNASEIFGIHEGEDIYSRLGTEPRITNEEMYYRQRVRDLEREIREPIQPMQPIREMPVAVPEDKPIKVEHFDESIFELE